MVRSYMLSTSAECHRKRSFRERCVGMTKQYKTRLYILRRCVVMLLCWQNYSLPD